MTTKKHLPTGIASFATIINENYLYIDKTKLIYELISSGKKYCFFTRPRRFGKSLLLSTLEELFKGNRALFNGLWIAENTDYDWKPYQVIRLDMSGIRSTSPEEFESGICRALDILGEENNIDLSNDKAPVEKLTYLIKQLSRKAKVVVLIDEYDYAIVNNIKSSGAENTIAKENVQVLHDFYIGLKIASEHIQFLFITGVSRFSRTSLFSALNNLNDLSFLPDTAALAGYTEEEINHSFLPYINDMISTRSLTREDITTEMRQWYNGYHFSKSMVSVYNPYSILYYFQNKECSNYWFKTGTPTFLINVIKNKIKATGSLLSLENVNHCTASGQTLENASLDNISVEALFYQTGYLTIQQFDPMTNRYTLTFPNLEVESSLGNDLLGIYFDKKYEEIHTTMAEMRAALL